MNISMIAAMGKNRVIAVNNQIPWNLMNDLLWFQQHTINKPVIMGRITYESLKKPLYNRMNIVISKTTHTENSHVIWVNSVEEALSVSDKSSEIMIIGGEKIYKIFLPYANKLYLTHVDINIYGELKFPNYHYYNWNIIFKKI